MATATVGTLFEYDLILAISQPAINAQFLNLYYIPDEDDASLYLMPHSMRLGFTVYDETEKKWKDTDDGLDASDIECPTVDINAVQGPPDENRAVRLSVKITTGTMTYHDDDDKLQSVTVDGWRFSWIAAIGSSVINDLDKEKMHPKAKKAMKDAVAAAPSENFLPSSMFCAFESTTVSKTFKLYNKDGKDVSDHDAKTFLSYFTTTYSHTDHLPWVLGYCVSQRIPNPSQTVPRFRPVRYWYSTTRCIKRLFDVVFLPRPFPSRTTLNFCMITAGPHDDALVDPTKNANAGILSKPFVEVTRATNLSSDGILAMSCNTFYEQWLRPIVLDPVHGPKPPYYTGDGTPTTFELTGGNGKRYCKKVEQFGSDWWESYMCGGQVDAPGDPPQWGAKHWQFRVSTSVDVSYSSVLQDKPSGDIPEDTKRQLTVTVKICTTTVTTCQVSEPPSVCYDTSTTTSSDCDFSLIINAGAEGKWDVVRDPPNDYASAGAAEQGSGTSSDSPMFGISLSSANAQVPLLFSSATVMPSGDVFTFFGLDCDDEGNLYSHIKYRTIDSA